MKQQCVSRSIPLAWLVRTQVERLPDRMLCPCSFPTPQEPLPVAKHFP